MNDTLRMKKLLIALNDYMNSFSYYDDETDETVIDGDETECYNVIMQDDELHLLGTETVKSGMHTCSEDGKERRRKGREHKAT